MRSGNIVVYGAPFDPLKYIYIYLESMVKCANFKGTLVINFPPSYGRVWCSNSGLIN